MEGVRRTIGLAVWLGCSALMATPAQTAPIAKGETLRLQTFPGTASTAMQIVAEAKGFCKKYNFTCQLQPISNISVAVQAQIAGSVDVTQAGIDLLIPAIARGADIVLVANAFPGLAWDLIVRSDIPLPHKDQGYPAVMQDIKGLKVGTIARGSAPETIVGLFLRGADMKPSDVTFVGVGSSSNAIQALTISKQIDALMTWGPMSVMCFVEKNCNVAVEAGDGPANVKALNGAATPMAMRREIVETNPELARAYVAAMTDALNWMKDPANFDELEKLFATKVTFGDMPHADELLTGLLKRALPTFDVKINRDAVKASMALMVANKTLDAPLDIDRVVWKEAP